MSASAAWADASRAMLGQAGERGAQLLGQRRVASEQSETDDHESSPRKSRRTSLPLPPVARASATADGARTVTEMPPERSMAGESNSRPRAATREPLRPEDHDVDESARVAAAACRGPIQRPARVRPHARRAGAMTARHSVRSAPRTQEVAAGQADERAAAGQRAERCRSSRACGRRLRSARRRHRRVARRRRRRASGAAPARRSGARRLRGAVQG